MKKIVLASFVFLVCSVATGDPYNCGGNWVESKNQCLRWGPISVPEQPGLPYGPIDLPPETNNKNKPNNHPTVPPSTSTPQYYPNPKDFPQMPPHWKDTKSTVEIAKEFEEGVKRLYTHVNVSVNPKLSLVKDIQRIVNKRDEARETIKKLSHYNERLETVEKATDFLKTAREYFLSKFYDEAMIATNIAEALLDVATSLTPGVSWARDMYESILGKDLHSGEVLDTFSRSMAILGACSLGFGNKAVKAYSVVEKVMKSNHQLDVARKLHHEKSFEELRDTIGFLRKYKIYDPMDAETKVSIANAFMKNSKTRVLTEDLVVYRYYLPGADPRGAWVTTKLLDNPEQMLALKDTGYLSKSWTIPKGTEILEGIVAPKYERAGGGYQILVNKGYLRE